MEIVYYEECYFCECPTIEQPAPHYRYTIENGLQIYILNGVLIEDELQLAAFLSDSKILFGKRGLLAGQPVYSIIASYGKLPISETEGSVAFAVQSINKLGTAVIKTPEGEYEFTVGQLWQSQPRSNLEPQRIQITVIIKQHTK